MALAPKVHASAYGDDSEIQPPPTIASIKSPTPMSETSNTRPGRRKRRYTPIKSAMGMVMAMENAPHGDSASAFTTTNASTASRMIMMDSTAMRAATPPTGPISSRAICPSVLPSLRMEKKSVVMSCTAPARMTPTMIQTVPGKNPIWAASTGPTSGPAPAIGSPQLLVNQSSLSIGEVILPE